MEIIEILQVLSLGEDSKNQFKRTLNNADALAQEIAAFSNTQGGKIYVGVNDDGTIAGLSSEDIARINQLLSNAASQNIKPPVNPLTEIKHFEQGSILIIDVPKGMNKPYMDKNGAIWVKCGADKRKATAREELQRLFQVSGMLHADENPVTGLGLNDLDMPYFTQFFERRYSQSLEEQLVPLDQLIDNLNLGNEGTLNVTGALLFAKNPSHRLPSYIVKAVAFSGTSITEQRYNDSRDITGKIADVYQQSLSFVLANIRHIQGEQGINSLGNLEVPRIVLEELIANALIHRDYFIQAPIRLFVFADRVEIISPGHLPNNLTIANIKLGNSNSRNPVLASFAYHILPYRGIGSGILRALENYPDIDFIDDREQNLFKCIIWRKSP